MLSLGVVGIISENKVEVFRLRQNQEERKKWIKSIPRDKIHLIHPRLLYARNSFLLVMSQLLLGGGGVVGARKPTFHISKYSQ